MSNRITDLVGFQFGNHMTRVGSSVVVDHNAMMAMREGDLQTKIWSELIFGLTNEVTRAILAGEIPVVVFTEDTPMGDQKVKVEFAIVPKPEEMVADINRTLPFYTEETLVKVHDILDRVFGSHEGTADEAINDLQNAGILFRERSA